MTTLERRISFHDPTGDRIKDIESLFPLWDLDGSGQIEWPELQQVLKTCERVDSKRDRKLVAKLKGQLAEHGKIRPLNQVQFNEFMKELLAKTPDDEWDSTIQFLRQSIEDTHDITVKDKHMKVQWSLFQLLDVNQDGVIEFCELEALLHDEHPTKEQRKLSAKWQVKLLDKAREHGGEDLQLSLADFHKFMNDVFKDLSEEEYAEKIASIEKQLSLRNSESAHREYLKRENIPELVNEMKHQ